MTGLFSLEFRSNSPAQMKGGQEVNGGDAWYHVNFPERLDDKILDKKVHLEFSWGFTLVPKSVPNGQFVGHYPNGFTMPFL